jgi:hypothetical protein
MIYEYRVYEVVPGRMQDLHDRFKNHTLNIFTRHGIRPVAFFTATTNKSRNQLSYIVAFDNLEQRSRCWQNFLADPEWIRVKKESEKEEKLVLNVDSQIFNATEYSPVLFSVMVI